VGFETHALKERNRPFLKAGRGFIPKTHKNGLKPLIRAGENQTI
jgi:hypothetical protein